MSLVSNTRSRLRLLAVVGMSLSPALTWAVVPVPGPPPLLTPIPINIGAGDQYDPHVGDDWAGYSSDFSIRHFRFSTGVDTAIPLGPSARDLLSDTSGSAIVFSRVIPAVKTAVMVFDAATGAAPIEIDPAPGTIRIGSAIGGNTVAYIDFGLHPNGELVLHDLATSTSVRITTDTAFDGNPAVAPGGDTVVWEHCLTSTSNCDIWQAVKTGPAWTVSAVGVTPLFPDANPDTNGDLVVYDSVRAGNGDVFWRPVNGGPELQLQLPGVEANPSMAGDYILFESRPTLLATSDIYLYDVVNNRLFRITNTSLVTEQLNDISLLPGGRVRAVWSTDEDGFDQRNVRGATIELANIAPVLSYSAEGGYGADGVNPDTGSTTTAFTYKVVYSDFEDRAPWSIVACIDGTCHGMAVDMTAAGSLRDGDYRNGEQYAYTTALAAGTHAYDFAASDGTDATRLPAASQLAGPVVTADVPGISIDDVGVTEGNSGLTNATFRVRLSHASATPVTVWYFTWPGTATLFADFVPAVGQITIPAGHVQAPLTVKVRGELLDETDETFFVFLFAPQGSVIVDNQGQGTIVDDDQ